MQFISRWLAKATDSELILNLKAQQFYALLIKSGRVVGQLTIAETAMEQLKVPLQQLLQQHGCKRPKITLVLAETCYQQTQIEKPAVPDDEIRQALPWMVKELIAIAPDAMQLDYYDLPRTSDTQQINVIVVEKPWLQQWVTFLCTEFNGTLVSVKIEELALVNLLREQSAPVLLMWQQPKQDTQLLLVYQQALYLSRNLRATSGLSEMTGELLAGVVDSVSLEVQRALDYFEGSLRQPPVKKILLLLDGENQAAVCDLMNANLAAEVEVFSHPAQEVMALPDSMEWLPLLGATMTPTQEDHA